MRPKPETIAKVSVKEYCFSKKQINGVVEASQFKWTFTWSFNKGLLLAMVRQVVKLEKNYFFLKKKL